MTDLLIILNEDDETILKVTQEGEFYYNFKGELKKIDERDEILDAFKYCILGLHGEEPDKALFNKFIEKMSNGKLNNNQLKQIEKHIRKIKLKNLKL